MAGFQICDEITFYRNFTEQYFQINNFPQTFKINRKSVFPDFPLPRMTTSRIQQLYSFLLSGAPGLGEGAGAIDNLSLGILKLILYLKMHDYETMK